VLRTRLLLAACILVPLLGLVAADFLWNFGAPGIWLFPVGLAINAAAATELRAMAERVGPRPPLAVCLAGIGLVHLAGAIPIYGPLWNRPYPPACPLGPFGLAVAGLLAAMAVGFAWEMARYREPNGQALARLAYLSLSLVYLALPIVFLFALRRIPGNGWGLIALLSPIITVKLADAGAYAVGKSIGRTRLAPRLSPQKTVEGAIGGALAAAAGGLGCATVLVPALVPVEERGAGPQIPAWIGMGIAVALAGLVGDLAESLLKRDAGVKDSSQWLPGLGGALDLLDSVLFAAPVAYVFWLAGWIGPLG